MYVIVGGAGFLGSYLIKQISVNSDEKIIATYHTDENLINTDVVTWVHLDVGNENSVNEFIKVIADNKKDGELVKCIYVVGYIRPDNCIKNPEIAVDINIRSLVKFLYGSKSVIDALIFTSTDFVVGESMNDYKYKETDIPSPVNLFGMIKYTCETIVLSYGYNVVRLPFMFGKSLISNKFNFVEHIEQSSRKQEYFDVLSDYYETSLDYNTVAECIYRLFEKFKNKIPEKVIHIASDKKISKYEIAVNYLKKHNLDQQYIKPLPLKDASFFVAKRCTILMDNTVLKKLLCLNEILINY